MTVNPVVASVALYVEQSLPAGSARQSNFVLQLTGAPAAVAKREYAGAPAAERGALTSSLDASACFGAASSGTWCGKRDRRVLDAPDGP
jgi:hypothetical protein